MAERASRRAVQFYSREKLEEFREMTVEARLGWLEEANALVNSVLGYRRRAETDERFEGFADEAMDEVGCSRADEGRGP